MIVSDSGERAEWVSCESSWTTNEQKGPPCSMQLVSSMVIDSP